MSTDMRLFTNMACRPLYGDISTITDTDIFFLHISANTDMSTLVHTIFDAQKYKSVLVYDLELNDKYTEYLTVKIFGLVNHVMNQKSNQC